MKNQVEISINPMNTEKKSQQLDVTDLKSPHSATPFRSLSPGPLDPNPSKYSQSPSSMKLLWQSLELVIGLGLVICSYWFFEHPLFPISYASFFMPTYIAQADLTSELQRWVYMIVFMIGLYATFSGGFHLAFQAMLFVLQKSHRYFSIQIQESMNLFLVRFAALRDDLVWFFTLGGGVWIVNHMILEDPLEQEVFRLMDHTWQFYIRRTFIASWFYSIIISVKHILHNMIAYQYHRVHYSDRLRESTLAMNGLLKLKDFAVEKASPAVLSSTWNHSLNETLEELSALGSEAVMASKVPPSQAQKAGSTVQEKDRALASRLSKLLFAVLRPSSRSEDINLTLDDFPAVLSEDAALIFNLLDKDGNGDLTRKELKDSMFECFCQRRGLAKSLIESETILHQFHSLLGFFAGLIIFTVVLPFFNIPMQSVLSLGGLFFTFGFAFNDSITKLFQSIMFVFVNHPYDVGDRVTISGVGTDVVVQDIGLFNTTFCSSDGQLIYIPNTSIMSNAVNNSRRSAHQSETLSYSFPITTPMSKLSALKLKLEDFLKRENRDFMDPKDFFTVTVDSLSSLKVRVVLGYKSNFQDLALRWERRERFDAFFVDAAQSLDLVTK